MLKNYLKIAFRNLLKHKQFSFINIFGLAIGLACFILIMLWVQHELSYNQFHHNAGNKYLVLRCENGQPHAVTTLPFAAAIKTEIPEVIDAAAFCHLPESFKMTLQTHDITSEESAIMTSADFFNLFSFPFLHGNAHDAFQNPKSLIMTERLYEKYFGQEKMLGKTLILTFGGKKQTMTVSGILANLPENSTIQRELFIPVKLAESYGINWNRWETRSMQTYIETHDMAALSDLEQKITDCKQRYYKEKGITYSLLPLTDVHLHAGHIAFFASAGDIKYIYIFTAIAAVILMIACINYVNLFNAISLKRIKMIGIQKVIGALRGNLIRQYFMETTLLTGFALVLALILAEFLLPTFSQLAGKQLKMDYFNPQFWVLIAFTLLGTSLISGFYPALYVSGLKPIQILKGKMNTKNRSFSLRHVLVIFQFTLTILMIVCTLTIFNQLKYIRNANLGYQKDNLVCLRVKGNISQGYDAFKNRLLKRNDFISMARSEPLDAASLGTTEGISWQGKSDKFSAWLLHVDADFADTYKLTMQSGRFYSQDHPSDETSAYVLNETAIQSMGIEPALGKELTVWGRTGNIIGIVKDFHFNSLHHAVEPLIFRIPDEQQKPMDYREITIRIQSDHLHETIRDLKSNWQSAFPEEPFDFYFFDEHLNKTYQAEQRMSTLFQHVSILAILIACLGLYGLTALTIEQKTKDIGMHKVLGASVPQIIHLISRHYLWWIGIASVIAWPLAWFGMNRWLQNFVYRIDLTIWPFLLAGVSAMVIAFITISGQTVRAALGNPVEALKYE